MEIYINGKRAAIKAGSSFDFVSENRMFSDADDYSLNITFPLRGYQQNIEIFGNIYNDFVFVKNLVFDCEIHDRRFSKSGYLAITGVNESEVTGQFLGGRSKENYDFSFDDIYINELDLGTPRFTRSDQLSPEQAWSPQFNDFEAVALPWWNDSDDGLAHNFAIVSEGESRYQWVDANEEESTSDSSSGGSRPGGSAGNSGSAKYFSLTWQPYLLSIAKKICGEINYSFDFSDWENSDFRYLIICNTLPQSWEISNFARALPHWTVEEFFRKLEPLLNGEFELNHLDKVISFKFTNDILNNAEPVALDEIISEFDSEFDTVESKCDYSEATNLVYKEPDYEIWKFLSCDWFIKLNKDKAVVFDTLQQLIEAAKPYRNWDGNSYRADSFYGELFYAKDVDAYFFLRTVDREKAEDYTDAVPKYNYRCVLQPANLLGGRIVDDDDDAKQDEIEFIPVHIDFTEEKYGRCMFINCSSYNDSDSSGGKRSTSRDELKERFLKLKTQSIISNGEPDDPAEYFSNIFVAFWDGKLPMGGKLPFPVVENISIADDFSGYSTFPFSLRLNDKFSGSHKPVYNIHTDRKYKFKFLYNEGIPDVRALFFIHGKRYIAEKITASFSENGVSQLMQLEAWQLIDEE